MHIPSSAAARPASIVQGERYRITVLTSRLIRVEYSETGVFEDRPTQTMVCRDFPTPDFTVRDENGVLTVDTGDIILTYDKGPFCSAGLAFRLSGNLTTYLNTWRYGEPVRDLGGTARTLDECNGATALGPSLLSWRGFTVHEDSRVLALDENGWVAPRQEGAQDLYFFGYGRDYLGCLRDFYRLCGPTPLLPRYALGNWWSRYYRYTQDEYLALMDRFESENVPLAVSVIDMDWHLVNIDPKYGSGWTGYTWNRELFPDHRAMLQTLHDKGLRVTLNVHPAEGVRAHEDAYPAMAKALGYDTAEEKQIPFDAASPEFFDAYFNVLHHPMEEEGVDFWWIDWQQGNTTRIPGLDPLWMLNHYHYLDNCRDGRRGMILSRYAGLGSHRYPLGFSGDTHITWESLAFQPYFTVTASNVGYNWWSHDIGGHMCGYKDEELATRWLQFGVFSPIMRLHSTSSAFNSKEPWRYSKPTEQRMKRWLRLRHELIPYLYTMMARDHTDGVPLMQPMYYAYPMQGESYEVQNQYLFGSEMIVCPITAPADKQTGLAAVGAWLPEGTWFDFFCDRVYRGGRKTVFHRDADSIPVLVKAGGIVPTAVRGDSLNDTGNPDHLCVYVFPGANGDFALYEDDDRREPLSATTRMTLCWDTRKFTVHAAKGERAVLPERRTYTLCFCGFDTAPHAVTVNGNAADAKIAFEGKRIFVTVEAGPADTVEVCFPEDTDVIGNDPHAEIFELLDKAQISFFTKEAVYGMLQSSADTADMLAQMHLRCVERELAGPITELLTAM